MWHELKIDPAEFLVIFEGLKTFEIRLNDRNFNINDFLILKETKFSSKFMKENSLPLEYTGRQLTRQISNIVRGPVWGLRDSWVIMSLKEI